MSGSMKSAAGAYQLYINGEWVPSATGKAFSVYEPATERVMAMLTARSRRHGRLSTMDHGRE
jgi:hypothetical protein